MTITVKIPDKLEVNVDTLKVDDTLKTTTTICKDETQMPKMQL